VPSQAERDLTQAVSTALTAAAKLEAIDADGADGEAAAMLTALGKALGIQEP